MNEKRLNYNYAQINVLNVVVSISATWKPIPENHPYYDKMIHIREFDENLVGKLYVGRDEDGYGIFTERPSNDEQSETVSE